MSVLVPDLMARLNADDDAAAEATTQLALAQQKVATYVANYAALTGVEVAALDIPDEAMDEAVLRCAVDLFNRAAAPNGVLMTAYDDSGSGSVTPLRAPRDPLRNAKYALDPWVPLVWGFR